MGGSADGAPLTVMLAVAMVPGPPALTGTVGEAVAPGEAGDSANR